MRSQSPTFDCSPPCQPDYGTEFYIQLFLQHLQGLRLHLFPGKFIPMFNSLFCETIPPDVQPEPPPLQLDPLSSCPVPGCLRIEADTCLATTATVHCLYDPQRNLSVDKDLELAYLIADATQDLPTTVSGLQHLHQFSQELSHFPAKKLMLGAEAPFPPKF